VAVRQGESVSSVEINRSADTAIAVIGLVFNGVAVAKTLWDWWQARPSRRVNVTVLLGDGTQVELSGVDQKQLERALSKEQPRQADVNGPS
jgi:hypothetical protein